MSDELTTPFDPPTTRPTNYAFGAVAAIAAAALWIFALAHGWAGLHRFAPILPSVGMGLAALAARWVVNGGGRWWVRLSQVLTFLTAVSSATCLWIPLYSPPIPPGAIITFYLVGEAVVFLPGLVLLGLENQLRNRRFLMGAVPMQPPTSHWRISIADMFQITLLVAILIVSLRSFGAMWEMSSGIYPILIPQNQRLPILLGMGFITSAVSILPAWHATLPDEFQGPHGFGIIWFTSIVLFILAWKNPDGLGGFVLFGLPAYLLVYSTLTALRAFGWFDVETATGSGK